MKKPLKITYNKGSSILEVLIAIAILTVGISASAMLVFGNQSIQVDNDTNSEALYKAKSIIETARANSIANFSSINSMVPIQNGIFSETLSVRDLTQCRKEVSSTVAWLVENARPQEINLITDLTDIASALALGGDCASEPPRGGWNPPELFARDTISPGKFSSLDSLKKIVYLGSSDTIPFLFIADTRSAVFNNSSNQPLIIGGSVPFVNTFNSSGEVIDDVNDIDAFFDVTSGKTYVFLATASSTAQLAVVDVTDIMAPTLVATRKLKNITATNSTSWGWKLYYYDGKLYITARETAGPELHVYDVAGLLSNPLNPTPPDWSENELGSKELNTTVNDFVVRDGLAYFADESDARSPLLVYDVEDPTGMFEILGARPVFTDDSGNPDNVKNGESVYLLGNKLYFGREKTPGGPEFYIFDASDPRSAVGGLPVFRRDDPLKEMNKEITNIKVIGDLAFLASYGFTSGEFDVWDISNPNNIKLIYSNFNFTNRLRAIDYEDDFVYAVSDATPNFQMLCSGPIVAGNCNN